MIYILCPDAIRTGGPEALHQLSDALLEQGFDARMVYYTPPQIEALARARPDDSYRFGAPTDSGFEEYSHYKRVVTTDGIVPNALGEVIVLPEPLCHLVPKFNRARVLVWWLSVDNGFGALSRVNLNHLRAGNVNHVAQSLYADRFIKTLRLPPAPGAFLSDYTVDLREYVIPLPWADRPKLIVFAVGPKVTADIPGLARAVQGIAGEDVAWATTKGKSRAAMAEMFATARVFVDLGCMPGKDRMPREASLMGCSVLTNAHSGAGDEFSGEHIEGVEDAAETIAAMLTRQPNEERARHIQFERATFFHEVKTVFGGRTLWFT